ncbi:hypothetical protein HK104_000426 [Borealophlyctis nickersoniae]|nr:hypothetical protein HK104_000426 [Borealophlyctis nickersoniae]
MHACVQSFVKLFKKKFAIHFPAVNRPLVSLRIMDVLHLPVETYGYVCSISALVEGFTKKSSYSADEHVLLFAYFLVVMKLFYGLDGQERDIPDGDYAAAEDYLQFCEEVFVTRATFGRPQKGYRIFKDTLTPEPKPLEALPHPLSPARDSTPEDLLDSLDNSTSTPHGAQPHISVRKLPPGGRYPSFVGRDIGGAFPRQYGCILHHCADVVGVPIERVEEMVRRVEKSLKVEIPWISEMTNRQELFDERPT